MQKKPRMMKPFMHSITLAMLLGAVLAGLSSGPSLAVSSGVPTLEDFGYQNKKINGVLPLGSRRLLVIIGNFAGGNPFAHDIAYYDALVFNVFKEPSLAGYFLVNSNGRFLWTRAGIIGPLQFSASERWDAMKNDAKYTANIVAKAMQSGFNFAPFDANSDGQVTGDELGILAITNDGDNGGAARSTDPACVQPAGSPVKVCNFVALVNHQTSFSTMAHELSHLLGTLDLYGSANLSKRLTLMSWTSSTKDDPQTFHLDPWHKMQLGWVEPRIQYVTSGFASLPAAQMLKSDGPVILFDPSRGASEFFILEYRTQTSPNGGGYDNNVAGNGLVIWHVQQDANKNPTLIPALCAGSIPGQPNWRWCRKCQGLHFITDPNKPVLGPCPAGGVHDIKDSGAYLMVDSVPSAPGQHDWRWCWKCQGLFFGLNQSQSVCPAGGTHDGSQSGNYSLEVDSPSAPGQHDWRWCWKCQGLFFGLNQSQSVCPAGGTHNGSSSGNYSMLCDAKEYVVFSEGWDDLRRGGNSVWDCGLTTPRVPLTTPRLRWLDGSEIPSRIQVGWCNTGDASINVTWGY